MLGVEWLKQRIISWLLSRYVGRWIHVDQKKLHAQTQGQVWTLTATDLQLKKDCLDNLGIPFAVRDGSVKKLAVVWSEKGPVQIHIDTIFVVLQSCTARELSPEQLRAAEQQVKRALLENWEAQLDSSFSPQVDGDQAPQRAGDDRKDSSIYAAIIDKLEVSISGVTLCYYDTASEHTFGARIEALGFRNEAAGDFAEHAAKSVSMQGFSIFLNHSRAPKSPGDADVQVNQYLLCPTSVDLKIGHDTPASRRDATRPKIAVQASVSSVMLQAHRSQYVGLVALVDQLEKHTQRPPFQPGRPRASPSEDARGWWRYVLELVAADLRERRHRRSRDYLLERRKARLQYSALYVKLRAATLTKRELAAMSQIEDDFKVHDLIFFRCTALKRLRDEKKKVQRVKTWWYGRLMGGLARGNPDGEGLVGDDDEAAPPFMALSLEEREALLAAMDVDPGSQGHAHHNLFRSHAADQCMYTVAIECAELAVRCIDVTGVLDVSATLSSAALHIEGKAHEVSLKSSMKALEVVNVLTGGDLCRQTGRVVAGDDAGDDGAREPSQQRESAPLLVVAVEQRRGCSSTQTSVSVRLAELDFLLDAVTLQSLIAFWRIPDQAVDWQAASRFARHSYPGLAVQGARVDRDDGGVGGAQLGEPGPVQDPGAHGGHRIILDIGVASPNIYLTEKVQDNGRYTQVVVVRLGQLTVRDLGAQHGSLEAGSGAGGEEGGPSPASGDASELAAPAGAVLNRYSLQMTEVGVDLVHDCELPLVAGLGKAEKAKGEPSKIIDDTRLDATIALCRPGAANDAVGGAHAQKAAVEVDARLDAVVVRASTEDLCGILRVASSWQPAVTSSTAGGSVASSAKVIMSGWLLVKGLPGHDGWCWRWLRLHRMSLHCCKSEDPSAAPDHVIPIDVAPMSTARVNGVKVLALRLEGTDDGSVADPLCAVAGKDDGDGGADDWHPRREIWIYAGAHYSSWQASIRRAQMEINWLLDADTMHVAQVLVAANAPRLAKASASLSFKVAAPSLVLLLHHDDSDAGTALLDCRMAGVSGSFSRSTHRMCEVAVAGLAIRTAARGNGGSMRTVLGQRGRVDAASGETGTFLLASLAVEEGSKIPSACLRVQAMDV